MKSFFRNLLGAAVFIVLFYFIYWGMKNQPSQQQPSQPAVTKDNYQPPEEVKPSGDKPKTPKEQMPDYSNLPSDKRAAAEWDWRRKHGQQPKGNRWWDSRR